MEHSHDNNNPTTDSVSGAAMQTVDLESGDHDDHDNNDDHDDDDDDAHDQLPSVEEYKSNMSSNGTPSRMIAGLSSPRRRASSSDEGGTIGGDDDEEEYVHDQLPDADEIKAGLSTGDDGWGAIRYFAIFVGLVVLTVIIVVPTILTQSSSQNQRSTGQRPTTTPSPLPAPTEPPQQRMDAIIEFLANLGISSESKLKTGGTPQNKAVEWMAFSDEFRPRVPSPNEKYFGFVERYVLAVLYFSTNGPSWTYRMKFLTGVHHCEWHDDFLTGEGATLRYGVSDCSTEASSSQTTGERLATALSLRKYCVQW